MRVSGYSYGDSIIQQRNQWRVHASRRERAREQLALVAEFIHPGNLGTLPPSPEVLAYKGEQAGLLTSREALDIVITLR